MIRAFLVAALCCITVLPASAQPNTTGKASPKLVSHTSEKLPPAGYTGQWWTAPDECQYSRAGRPGETVWYLIVNTAHDGCARRLIQRAYSDYQ